MTTTPNKPWYTYPIMWLIIFPPAASVLAGIVTMTLVLKHPDHDVRPEPVVATAKGHTSNSVVPPAE
jgi:hypothetical protein